LHQLAKHWPKTLWLFSESGNLEVHKVKPDGTRYMTGGGSVSIEGIVATIQGIVNDGGGY